MALELPTGDRELIKCVVVGDSGVGKTKLICAQALGQGILPEPRRSLLQCSHGSHKPSVFAIDKYYKSPEIQARSNMTVDGVEVALRLWDTFGDHQKNRRFAYQHSHVVALCFAVNCPPSLESVNKYWYKEIKHFCPRIPIILVGTKSDCRLEQCPEEIKPFKNSSLSEQMRQCSMVSPEMGRRVAKEIGANYYESSVLHMIGLEDVFHNIIRAALCCQRTKRLLSKQLRKVLPPQLQIPHKPPKPQTPLVEVPPSTYHTDMGSLLHHKLYHDVVFVSQGKRIKAHRMMLVAASCDLQAIFHVTLHEGQEESKCAPSSQEVRANSLHVNEVFKVVNIEENQRIVTEIDMGDSISFQVLYNLLELLYSGATSDVANMAELVDAAKLLKVKLFTKSDGATSGATSGVANMAELVDAAKLLKVKLFAKSDGATSGATSDVANMAELVDAAKSPKVKLSDSYLSLNSSAGFISALWKDAMSHNMKQVLFKNESFSDICFELEGTVIPAHKAILVSRCEMMAAMFEEGHFKEANRPLVKLTDMNLECFLAVLEYLYTDEVSKQYQGSKVAAMALANFFCLPRLVAMYERLIVEEIEMDASNVRNVIEYLLAAEMHNASQLKSWGEHYITVHYDKIIQQNRTELSMLPLKTAQTLEARRWPPQWYLTETEWYKKTMNEQEAMHKLQGKRRWYHKPHQTN